MTESLKKFVKTVRDSEIEPFEVFNDTKMFWGKTNPRDVGTRGSWRNMLALNDIVGGEDAVRECIKHNQEAGFVDDGK